ncbi:MAG: lytic transglycosylase domain-containing protein, partial [Nocardioides sp.]
MMRTAIRVVILASVATASAGSTYALARPTPPPAESVAAVAPPSSSSGVSLVPDRVVDLAASVSPAREVRAASDDRFVTIGSRPDAGEIPVVALAAYQRAESVIGSADARCHLPWQLVAAIGRVESDHGRAAGSQPGSDGRVRPAIIGPVLDGAHGTRLIRDTDAGLLDGDVRFDRAVGPMQFIPSTWAVIGVDADSDGARDPQDIDDAALGAAVYLCSGAEDLRRTAGLRVAVWRYNHSATYVDQVVSVMQNYLVDDYTSSMVQPSIDAGFAVRSAPRGDQVPEQAGGTQDPPREAGETRGAGSPGSDPSQPTPFPTTPAQPTAPVEPVPTDGPTDGPTGGPTDGPT